MAAHSDKKWQHAGVIGTWIGAIVRVIQIFIHEH